MRTARTNPSLSLKDVTPVDEQRSLSALVWGLDWNRLLPLELKNPPIQALLGNYLQAAKFAEMNFERIYGPVSLSPFCFEESSAEKVRYYKLAADHFIFQYGAIPIGIFVGTPSDWSSYYIRNISLLPEYQGKGIYTQFLARFLDYLGSKNIDRVEVDVSPLNHAHLHVLNKLGFITTGMHLSERWGSLLRLSKILSAKHRTIFQRQFAVAAGQG